MLIRLLFFILVFLSSQSYAAGKREETIIKIIEAQQTQEIFQQQIDEMRQFANERGQEILRSIQPETGDHQYQPSPEMEAAFQRYLQSITHLWKADELVKLWAQYYGQNLSDDDLNKILAYYVSPIGQKDVAASKSAIINFSKSRNEEEIQRLKAPIQQLEQELRALRQKELGAAVDQSIKDLKQKAIQQHPNEPLPTAVQQEALKQSQERLSKESDPKKRQQSAAAMFLGAYLLNTKERSEYCREQGVDIQIFETAYEKIHSQHLAKALSALSPLGIDQSTLYAATKKQLHESVSQDMEAIATNYHVSTKAVCDEFASNGEIIANEMNISKIQPGIDEALLLSHP